MSFIIDQVLRVDNLFDRNVQHSLVREDKKISVYSKSRLSRITELQRYIKLLSTSTYSASPIIPSFTIIQILKNSNLSSSYQIDDRVLEEDDDDEDEEIVRNKSQPIYENQLEELLLCKAITQTYGIVLNTILEQTLKLNHHIWYWDDISNSQRSAGLYSLQMSPLRLWSWSKSVVEQFKSKNNIDNLQQSWNQFYSLIKDAINETSLLNIQTKTISPLAKVKNEAIYKQKELKRIKDINSNALGILLGEGLSNFYDDRENNQILKSITLLESVLTNVQDSNADMETFETNIADLTQDNRLSNQSIEKMSNKLITILSYELSNYNLNFESQVQTLGKPSRIIRYWLPVTILILSSGTILKVLFNRKQQILTWVQEFGSTVKDFWLNWLVEPIKKLIGTIRHDEESEIAITSKRSLQGDRESLERMVIDFVVSEKGDISDIERQSIQSSIKEGDLTTVLKAYEKDIQKPIIGALRGKLITTLLIQVQKSKVDLEIAMGGIDNLLKSQELVFGFVGLTPGIIVIFSTMRWLSNTFGNKSSTLLNSQQNQLLRVLRNIDRIITKSQPSNHGVLYYKDYGLLLCESHILRQVASKALPAREYEDLLVDLKELTDIQIGVERQKMVIRRIRWGYSKFI